MLAAEINWQMDVQENVLEGFSGGEIVGVEEFRGKCLKNCPENFLGEGPIEIVESQGN